jgi:hypothetical protein
MSSILAPRVTTTKFKRQRFFASLRMTDEADGRRVG